MYKIDYIMSSDNNNDFEINYYEKRIYDNIHGFIDISNIAVRIIDTRIFKRLKKLRQLGTCDYVFPSGVHTRFEHSIGTYHLAGKLLKNLRDRTSSSNLKEWLMDVPELKRYIQLKSEGDVVLDDFICELVKIAGLCHDLGHGPFSHMFDVNYLVQNFDGLNHEIIGEHIICEELGDLISRIKRSPTGEFNSAEIINPEHVSFIINQHSLFIVEIAVDKS